MMSSYELHWYRWLRRELLADLGIPFTSGRPRAMEPEQEFVFFKEVVATPRMRRAVVIARWAAKTGAKTGTLKRILSEQTAANGGTDLRTFHMEHSDKPAGDACA